MKAVLKFDFEKEGSDDEQSFKECMQGGNALLAIDAIWDQCFRPYFKHGYPDSSTEKLTENLPEDEHGDTIIHKLAGIYTDILREYNIDTD